uniref:CCHC-type domain-containing protein n=1 Tax=Globodera pallida TaxID=36090 RepID=A0A183CNF4_GLOPA
MSGETGTTRSDPTVQGTEPHQVSFGVGAPAATSSPPHANRDNASMRTGDLQPPEPEASGRVEAIPSDQYIEDHLENGQWYNTCGSTNEDIAAFLLQMARQIEITNRRVDNIHQWVLWNAGDGDLNLHSIQATQADVRTNQALLNTMQNDMDILIRQAGGRAYRPRNQGTGANLGASQPQGGVPLNQQALGRSTGRFTLGPAPAVPQGPVPAVPRTTKKSSASKPPEYNGERGQKARDFTFACNLYISTSDLRFDTVDQQILFVVSYLRGEAREWIRPFLEKEMSGIPQPILNDMTLFEEAFEEAFGEVEQAEVYRQKYRNLKQTKSVVDYISNFRTYSSALGYNEATLKDDFYSGLKDEIQDVMSIQNIDRHVVTLTQLMNHASRIDANLIARNLERKAKGLEKATSSGTLKKVTTSATAQKTQFKEGDKVYTMGPKGATRGQITKIGNNKKGFKIPTIKWEDGSESELPFPYLRLNTRTVAGIEVAASNSSELTCYRCQKKGHIAKNCVVKIAALEEVSDEESGKGSV